MHVRYIAYDTSRRRRTGVVTAQNVNEVLSLLNETGWHVIAVLPAKPPATVRLRRLARTQLGFSRVSTATIAFFYRQLAAALGLGVPVVTAVESQLAAASGRWRQLLASVRDRIQAGMLLSDAMSGHPRVFRPLFVEIIRAGEATGAANRSLERCAGILTSELRFRRQLRSALAYPAFLLLLGAGAGSYIIFSLLPQIAGMLANLNISLPLPTRLVLGAVQFADNHRYHLFAATLSLGGLVVLGAKVPALRTLFDRLTLGLPVFGRLVRQLAVTRYCQVLGETMGAGVPVGQALTLSARATGNRVLAAKLEGIIPRALATGDLAAAIDSAGILPPLAVQAIRLSETQGALTAGLANLAGYLEFEAEQTAKTLTTLIEPLLILAVTGAMLFLVFSVIMPIYTVVGNLGRG